MATVLRQRDAFLLRAFFHFCARGRSQRLAILGGLGTAHLLGQRVAFLRRHQLLPAHGARGAAMHSTVHAALHHPRHPALHARHVALAVLIAVTCQIRLCESAGDDQCQAQGHAAFFASMIRRYHGRPMADRRDRLR